MDIRCFIFLRPPPVWKVGGSNPRSGQAKDLKFHTCCFPG